MSLATDHIVKEISLLEKELMYGKLTNHEFHVKMDYMFLLTKRLHDQSYQLANLAA
jgi:hypothetical protein